MVDEIATPEQIAEYETQLFGINELLAATPGDESLLALKKDIEELMALTKASLEEGQGSHRNDASGTETGETAADLTDGSLPLPPPPPLREIAPRSDLAAELDADFGDIDEAVHSGAMAAAAALPDDEPATTDNNNSFKKKSRKKETIEDFVLPPHLVPNEADTEAERNKKRRTAKALKNKWRQRKKEVESTNKQKLWLSFQKKTKRKRDDSGSIFSIQEGVHEKVGVVSKKHMTEFPGQTRHK